MKDILRFACTFILDNQCALITACYDNKLTFTKCSLCARQCLHKQYPNFSKHMLLTTAVCANQVPDALGYLVII